MCGEDLQSLGMSIPMDMVLEILLRLPVKSLGRFVCVSKLWGQVIHSEEFLRWYSSRSPQHKQRFLLAFTNAQQDWYFFSRSSTLGSTPPPHNPSPWRKKERRPPPPKAEEQEEPEQVADSDWEPPQFLSSAVCLLKQRELRYTNPSHAHGLISFLYGEEQVVCNPSTGKSVTLPTVVNSTEMIVRSFLGYDPIAAQYKVLCLTNVTRFCQHQVLTLASSSAQTQTQTWTSIQCSTPHVPLPSSSSVCIHGVLYYTASPSLYLTEPPFLLAGFDLSSETFQIASKFPQGFLEDALLINYHGKPALVTEQYDARHLYSFALWVLKDAQKPEWSKETLCFCPVGPSQPFRRRLRLVGASDVGEFIFASEDFGDLHFYFVHPKSNRINRMRSVQLQGSMNRFHCFSNFFTFLPHVESLMFI